MKKLFFLLLMMTMAILQAQVSGGEAALAERYYLDGEFEEALELYEKLNRRSPGETYALRIVSCYEQLGNFDEGMKFLDRTIRKDGKNPIYPTIKAGLLEKTGDLKAADNLYEDVIEKKLRTEGDFIRIGAFLYQSGKLDLSRQAYEEGRKRLRNNYVFANEIANIYAQQGNWAAATDEFLREYFGNPQNLEKVNLDILNLVNPQSEAAIEKALLGAIDKQNNDLGLRSILFEFYVLAENFFESFVQVKSIDRLFREDGNRVFKFAETMRNNKRYDLSNEAFDYIIDRKKNSPYFFRAHMEKAVNNELKAFEQIPVDVEAVRAAVDTYEGLFQEFGREVSYFNAIYRQAKLRVFYLDEIEQARKDLEQIVQMRGIQPDEWAKAMLLIGDIQLMQKEYGNAKLTYTQITERFKSRQTGALAKYKLAQMAYYRGDFTESQARLGAIKDNTSNDISNDAIKLNLLIIDNTGLDTTTLPLEMFAQAQLLVYQRDYDDAMALLDSLAESYPTSALTDEILWEKTQIHLKRNNIPKALEYIDRILENHKEDIYGDDALYTKARLYDYNLKDQEAAQKYYLDFLIEYPGSLFSVEVRKRIRQLRKEG